MTNAWTAYQYRIFRFLLGTYLVVHFVHLLPWAGELFSDQGMLTESNSSPLFGIVPNGLALDDSPAIVLMWVAAGAAASVALALGVVDRTAAAFVCYVLACLFARNPLIANPALPYVGWMLLAHLFIPRLPPRGAPFAEITSWRLPAPIFASAWIVLALAYTYSGYTKLLSPSWISGAAIPYVLDNPLARDYWLRDAIASLPSAALHLLTWGVMYVELLFAPLALVRRFRPWLWSLMLACQSGFLFLLDFADLTVPMLLFHLLTFDPAWIRPRRTVQRERIYYDGACGLCHGIVRLAAAEDRGGQFVFSPLQGTAFARFVPDDERRRLPDSFVVQDSSGHILLRSTAVVHVARRLGGLWCVIGSILALVPRNLRDALYSFVGTVRHRLFPRPDHWCPVRPSERQGRFEG